MDGGTRTLTLRHTGTDNLDFPTSGLALALLWSRDEPRRVGEIAHLPLGGPGEPALFGRQPARPDDEIARLAFVRQRPGLTEATGPLRAPHISRDQLRLTAGGPGELTVENLGRCPLRVGGKAVDRAVVRVGDVLELQQQLLFLVVDRPLALPGHQGPEVAPFGEADEDGIVGESPAAWALRAAIRFVAERPAHVLVRGASGVGKELVAQAIHARSSRGSQPLVARNAATFPETLVDAELFGNARNYPNPGMPDRPGLIGDAHGTTLFLDEFGELPIALQAHLLRVLDAGEYTRLGETRARRADLRLVAATNRPESALKEDVLARFKLRVEIPDLNARREDLPLLARHLLRNIAKDDPETARRFFDGDQPRLTAAFVERLVRWPWTTHVRELDRLIWRALADTRGDVLEWPADVAPGTPAPSPARARAAARPDPEVPVVDPESLPREVIEACLERHGGRQEPAWRELGLASRHVLARLVKRYGLRVRGRSGGGA